MLIIVGERLFRLTIGGGFEIDGKLFNCEIEGKFSIGGGGKLFSKGGGGGKLFKEGGGGSELLLERDGMFKFKVSKLGGGAKLLLVCDGEDKGKLLKL